MIKAIGDVMSFLNELKRRNVIRVATAYMVASWLIIQVVETIFPVYGLGDFAIRTIITLLAIGFVPTLIFSWAFEITPEGLRREVDVVREHSITRFTGKKIDRIIIVLLASALGYFAIDKFILDPVENIQIAESAHQEGRSEALIESYGDKSIAVLPFVNMSADPEQEYFSDGISEELLNLLAKLPNLRVIARTSTFAYKDKDVKITDIAKELDVAHILEGSVRKSGNQIRITAQLIRTTDSSHLWSNTYDRTLDNIFAIQDEIAAAVVDELRVTLLGEAVPRISTTSPESYALYLQGRHLNDQLTKQAYEESEILLKEALAIDPEFAPAWRQLGITYRGQEDFGRPKQEVFELAQDAFERAVALDHDFAQAYASLSLLARYKFDFPAADEYLQNALRFKGDSGFPYGAAASLSRTFGRIEQSIDLARKSISHDPIQSAAYANLGYSLYYADRLDEAASAFRKAISLSPKRFRSYVYLGRVLIAQGLSQDALNVIEKTPHQPYRLTGLAMVYHALEDREASDQALSNLAANWSETMAFQIAEVHAFRGNKNEAFDWLQTALDTKDAGLTVLLGNPAFNDLTFDARFQSLVEKLGLLGYWQEMNLKQPEV